jgi:rRNA maturation protein Nop10
LIKHWNAAKNNQITIENLKPGMYTLRVMVPETGEQTVEMIVVNKR